VPTRRQWVLAPFGSVATLKQAELTFDGLASARISTTFNVDHRFIDADFLRETRVDFGEGRPAWRIREVAPEDRSEQAQQSELPQISAKDRRVVVESVPPGGGPSIDRLAETVTAFGRQCVIRAGGEDYVLTPASKASSGWITKHGRIERTGFWWSTSWRAEIKQPTPLSVVLAYWHLLIGDIQHANSGVGPGGG